MKCRRWTSRLLSFGWSFHPASQVCLGALGLLLSLTLLPTSTVQAEEAIVIDVGIDIHIANVTGKDSSQIRSVLTADLKREGAFTITAANQAKFLASVQQLPTGIKGTLTDAAGTPVLSNTFNGDWRYATHLFSDAITLKLIKRRGIASTKVTFISKHTGSKELYVMDIDGANVKRLSNDKSISLGPRFSFDGQQISYISYKSGYPDIWIVDLIKKSRRKLAAFHGSNSSAAISPDNKTVAMTLSKEGNVELYTMPITGGSPTRLTRTYGAESDPTWSPSGRQIAYVSDDRGSAQIFLIESTGGTPQRFPTDSGYTTEPDWSPDGSKLVYSLRKGKNMQIGVSDVRAQTQKIVTSTGSNESPSWTRNSVHVVFSRDGKLYLLNTQASKQVPTLINNGLTGCSQPSCSR